MSNELAMAIGLIIAVGALVLAVIAALGRGASASELDIDIASRIDAIHRDNIRLLERQYAEANAAQKQLVSVLTALVSAVAPLTSAKSDDEVADLLEDIQNGNSADAESLK